MTQINQNFDNNYAVQGQGRIAIPHPAQARAIRVPEYYLPEQKRLGVREYMEENPALMPIKMFFGPLIDHPFASLATWLGCGFLLDKYDKACGGNYDKSLLKKAANFGDKIENSKVLQSKPAQTVLGWFNKAQQQGGKVVKNVELFRAMDQTPSRPEWSMVKQEMIPLRQRIAHDFVEICEGLHLSDDKAVDLRKLGLNTKEKEALKTFFKKSSISEIKEAEASVFVQLSRLGKSEPEIKSILANADSGVAATKQEIFKAMGQNAEWLKKVKADTVGDYVNDVEKASLKLGNRVKIGLGKYKPFGINLGFLTKPLERTLGMDNVGNRLHSINTAAHTATGRFMAKFMQLTHRGLTFGGGKIGVLLFIAPALVEAAINVKKADNNQKVGTGVSSIVNHISWVFTFPLALKMMHTLGGAQYAGLSKKQVGDIRNIRDTFNEKNAAGEYADKAVYNEALTKAKDDIKKITDKPAKKVGFLTKCVSKLARFMTMDLGRFDGRNTGNAVTSMFTKLRNLPRNLLGVPMRFVIFGLLSMGVLDTLINKGIKTVFGESYDFEKEEERKAAKKEQKKFMEEDLNKRIFEAAQKQQTPVQPAQQPILNQQAMAMASRGLNQNSNAVHQIQQEKIDNYSYIPSPNNTIKSDKNSGKLDNYSYIPSQDSTIQSNKETNPNKRSYIPSQAAANIQKNYDSSGLQTALDRASRAENQALKVLAGNFEGM